MGFTPCIDNLVKFAAKANLDHDFHDKGTSPLLNLPL